MELLCIQSQEHPKLPQGELKAVIECEQMQTNLEVITEGLVILKDISPENLDDYYQILTRRLGYTHEVHQILKTSDISNLNEDILSISWQDYINENFAVRVKRFNSQIDTVAYERKAGSLILEKCDNIKVKLNNPNSLVRLVAFEDVIYVAIEKYHLDKKHFEDIKPHKRPFFYPGSDVNWKMKNGTAINLEHCGIKDYRTFHLDVRELKMYEKVASVVTDPPYGISTSTGDIDGDDIFKEFFHSIYDNMADDAYLCMASPHYVDLTPMVDEVGFEIVEQYAIKMHRSLTRIITVIKKSL